MLLDRSSSQSGGCDLYCHDIVYIHTLKCKISYIYCHKKYILGRHLHDWHQSIIVTLS